MHSRIMDAIDASGAEFVEVPLLIETCQQGRFDEVWVVTCGADEQRKRLMQRYGESVRVDEILATQLPTEAKIPFADVVIRTNCEPEAVSRSVSKALARRSG